METDLNNWHVQPKNQVSVNRVLQFLKAIQNTKPNPPHFVFSKWFPPQTIDMEDAVTQLFNWNTPEVQALLQTDVEKDLGSADGNNKMERIRDIRNTFLGYMRSVVNKSGLTCKEAIQMFDLIHMYLVFFQTEQYGLGALWNAIVKKLLEFIQCGYCVFLPYFMEWCPDMVTKENYPLCPGVNSWEQKIILAQNYSFTYRYLYSKHYDKMQQLYYNSNE